MTDVVDSEMTGTMVSRKSAATTAEETDNLVQDASASQKAAWEEAMRAIIDEAGQVANENTDFVEPVHFQPPVQNSQTRQARFEFAEI